MLKHINIGPLNVGVKYCLVMNPPFSSFRQENKKFVDLKERDTIKGTQYQLRNTPNSNDLGGHAMQQASWFALFSPWYDHKRQKVLRSI